MQHSYVIFLYVESFLFYANLTTLFLMIFCMNNPKTIKYFTEYLISDHLNFRAEIKAPLVAKSTIVTSKSEVKLSFLTIANWRFLRDYSKKIYYNMISKYLTIILTLYKYFYQWAECV